MCTVKGCQCRKLLFLILAQELGQEVGRLTRVGQGSPSGCFHPWRTRSPPERRGKVNRKGQSPGSLSRSIPSTPGPFRGKETSGLSPLSSKHSRGLSGEEICHHLTQDQAERSGWVSCPPLSASVLALPWSPCPGPSPRPSPHGRSYQVDRQLPAVKTSVPPC